MNRTKSNRTKAWVRACNLALLCALLSSCAHTLTVSGRIPTPLIEPLPVSIGFIRPVEFSTHIHREKLPRGGGDWTIELGALQNAFFETLFDALFQGVQPMEIAGCGAGDEGRGVVASCPDGFVRLSLLEYAFLPPELSGLQFFSASTKYQVELLDAGGMVLDTWVVVGYGKNEGGGFQSTEALNAATVEAIRDAGARVALEWPKQGNVRTWLDLIGVKNDPKPIM